MDSILNAQLVRSNTSEFRTQSLQQLKRNREATGTNTEMPEAFEQENSKYPSELQKTLMDFIVAYMLEEPNDMIDYAVTHFTKLQKSRHTASIRVTLEQQLESGSNITSSSSLDLKTNANMSSHRSSVFSEIFGSTTHTPEEETRTIIPKSDKQRKRLLDAIKGSIIFNELELQKMNDVVDAMYEKNVIAGDIIIREGEEGDNFYIIEYGSFDVYRGADHINSLSKGTFGEMGLLYNVARAATIQAVTNGKLWVMNRQTFRKILHKHELKKQERYKTLIKNVPVLRTLEEYEKTKIIDAFETKYFKKGDLICKEGADPIGVYFIESGVVSIYENRNNEGDILLVKFTKTHYFGHLGAMTGNPYSNSVYADTDVKCVFIDTANFRLYMKKCFIPMIKAVYEDFGVLVDDETLHRLQALKKKLERN